MNGPPPNTNYLGRLAIVLHAHLPYVRKNEKNSLEEDWLFQAILECYIPLLQVMESSKKRDFDNTKLTLSLSPTLLSLLQNKQNQKKFSSWIKTRLEFLKSSFLDKESIIPKSNSTIDLSPEPELREIKLKSLSSITGGINTLISL